MQSTVNRYANKAKINILDIVFQHGKLYWINTFTGTTTNEYKNSCFFTISQVYRLHCGSYLNDPTEKY